MDPNNNSVERAARIIKAGGVIAYPTEAVFGLGCDPNNNEAIANILSIKQRSPLKGLILIAESIRQLEPFFIPLDELKMCHVRKTWPGPITWLLPARSDVPTILRGNYPTIALRVTAHSLAAELCRSAGTAIVSTSANLAGLNPARTVEEVNVMFGDKLDYVLEGEVDKTTQPTMIRDAKTGKIIRPRRLSENRNRSEGKPF